MLALQRMSKIFGAVLKLPEDVELNVNMPCWPLSPKGNPEPDARLHPVLPDAKSKDCRDCDARSRNRPR